jgi:hypothetical protein
VISTKVISRSASLLAVAVYLCLAGFGALPKGMDGSLGVAFVPGLLLIWFPELIGSTILPTMMGGTSTRDSPPAAVALLGWVLLFAPPAVALLSRQATPIQRLVPR